MEAAREEEPPLINGLRDGEETSETCTARHSPTHPSPTTQLSTEGGRAELERALSRTLFQEHSSVSSTVELEAAERKRLDAARVQYVRLHLERRKKKMIDRKTLQCSERGKKPHSMKASPHQAQALSTTKQAKPPSAMTKVPQKVPKQTNSTLPQIPPPLPPRVPKTTNNSQPLPPWQVDKSKGGLKPCTPTEESRGRNHAQGAGKTKNKKMMHKQKGLCVHHQQQATAAERGRTGGKQPERASKPSSTHTEVGKEKASSSTRQPPNSQSKVEKTATNPPPPPPSSERPVGACRPVSAAEEYGLPNYVFEEGGKETTWKEKALTAREKTNKRPINILHKLHRLQVHITLSLLPPFSQNVYTCTCIYRHTCIYLFLYTPHML